MSEKERPYPMPKEPPSESYPTDTTYPPSKEYPTEYPPRSYYYDNLDLPNGKLTGYFKAYTIDYDRDPNRVLERGLPWYITMDWAIIGTAAVALGGTFHLSAYAESIGPGGETEVKLFDDILDVDEVDPARERKYHLEETIPANAIPADGAYKVVVLLTHSNTGKSGKVHFSRLAGFVEIPMLQFFSAEE